MSKYSEVMEKITALTKTRFREAFVDELEALKVLRLPNSVIEFFSMYSLDEFLERNIRLWTIPDIVDENTKYVPGCYLAPLGYVVFGSTDSGDAYCFDINNMDSCSEPSIVLVSHEVIDETTSATDAARLAKLVADNLYDFLGKFVREEVDEQCIC